MSIKTTRSYDHVALALLALAVAPAASAQEDETGDDEMTSEFEEAHVFFELNNTDNDLGIHAMVDGGPWTSLEIVTPQEQLLMTVRAAGPLWHQQVTELFFESEEPPFDELSPAEFFERFPAGTYEVEGSSRDLELENEVEVSHVMPAPPAPIWINEPGPDNDIVAGATPVQGDSPADWPAPCDSELASLESFRANADGSLVVYFDEVTKSHPEIGVSGVTDDLVIVNYQVVVEAELEIDDEEFVSILSTTLPPTWPRDQNGFLKLTIPADFVALAETYPDPAAPAPSDPAKADFLKVEVLAREASFNQTAVEGCFTLAE